MRYVIEFENFANPSSLQFLIKHFLILYNFDISIMFGLQLFRAAGIL